MGGLLYVCDNEKNYQIAESGETVSRRLLSWKKWGEGYDASCFAKEGETVTIRRIGGRDDVRQHLAELGFVVDSPVLIVSHMAGNLIVQVKGSRVALDRSMAQKIFY